MNLNPDAVPATHEAAVQAVIDALHTSDIVRIQERSFRHVDVHHSLGRHIRNSWSLWDKTTPLSLHYQQRFSLAHADDLSGLILGEAFARVRGELFDREVEVARFREHWARTGHDPMAP